MPVAMEDRVGYALKRAQQALNAAMTQVLEPLGLTPSSYSLLAAFAGDAGLSNADAARRTFVTPQTTHQLLQALERRALVERTPHPEHGRIRQVVVTSAGRAALEAADAAVAGVEARMTADLPAPEVARIARALQAFAAALGDGAPQR